MYVSVGHKISLETAVKLVLECSHKRVPEPVRQVCSYSVTYNYATGYKAWFVHSSQGGFALKKVPQERKEDKKMKENNDVFLLFIFILTD